MGPERIELSAKEPERLKVLQQVEERSIKGKVKKKHFSRVRSFSCFPAPVNEQEF